MSKDFRETLYTVDQRGRRKWVYSSLIAGNFFRYRQLVAYLLMSLYLLLPWISINGKQGVLLNFGRRRFIFFGAEFWATDTFFLFLLFGIMAFALFFFTALLGRVWCGWACPETVFLEFLFRPIERLIEGNASQRRRLDQQSWNFEKIRKKFLKHGLCAFFSWVLASTCLAYFIGREPLIAMMSDWPHKNPVPFAMTCVLMGVMAFQFGWFREQFCTVLCPYARFQSVLMDSNSVVVGYDIVRGEPRGKRKKNATGESLGDCVDCGLCVRVCPTGIDIRNGLQMECVACTACIDACDSIMAKVDKQAGLIRYDTENRLLGRESRRGLLRPRPVVYGLILCLFLGALGYSLLTRPSFDSQILRGALDKPYVMLADDRVSNHLHVRVSNRTELLRSYTFSSEESALFEFITPLNPLLLKNGETKTVPLFINFSKNELKNGKRKLVVKIQSNGGRSQEQEITLLGPDE